MGSDTPVGSPRPSGPPDLDAIGDAVEGRLQARIASTPETLIDEARQAMTGDARVRGQWLVIGARTGTADNDVDDVLPAATSVELLYTQAVINARAAYTADAASRDDALLASDYLHSLAYAALGEVDRNSAVLEACFDSLSSASQHLASLWTNMEETRPDDSDGQVPVDPIVMGAAGDLAGLLGDSDPAGRSALRSAGAALGIARWQDDGSPPTEELAAIVGEAVPAEWSPADVRTVSEATIEALLEPLPDTPATGTLRSFAETLLADAVDRRAVVHE